MLLRSSTRRIASTTRRISPKIFYNPSKTPISLVALARMSSSASAMPNAAAQPASTTPVEDTIRAKLTASLQPLALEVHNDSHLHSHHAAMQSEPYAGAKETHFRVRVVSDAFKGKMQPARHRMVYALLKEELQREGGVHALQIVTKTREEEEKAANKA